MRIQHINVFREDLELTRPYSIAYKTVTSVENVFVEVTLDNGLTGLGAANPSPYVVGEDLEACYLALQQGQIERFVGRDIRSLRGLCLDLQEAFPNNPGARAALDIAFHDAFTQHLGIPLVDYLGRCVEALPTSVTIGLKGVEETLNEAEEYVGRGFLSIKVKLGASLEEDLERIYKLRERYGEKVDLRVDANQGYTFGESVRFFEETFDLDLELIEQPMKTELLEEMRKLPLGLRNEIAVDESLVNPKDALQLAAPIPAFGVFNIKLMKCGGIFPALQIADIAHHSGIRLMWGCNDESIVSISAALHTAFACPQTRYIDLDGSLDLASDLVSGGFILEGGLMYPTDRPGLGVTRR